jgi:cation diffusion facilitator CzcD-associated flavoprotein CzcO
MSGYCVIGAGAAGLATAREFAAHGLDFEVLEASDGIGGIWDARRPDSPVSHNTHVIASKGVQAFSGFPMPEDYPDYPGHELVLRYLHSYADAFDLWPRIRLNTSVQRVEPGEGGWVVTLADGSERRYAGVVVATVPRGASIFPVRARCPCCIPASTAIPNRCSASECW